MKIFYKLITFSILFTSLTSCSSSDYSREKNENRAAIMKAEKDFCDYSVKEGFYKAFLKFADKDVVKLNAENFPVTGLKRLTEFYGERTGPKNLIWKPMDGEVAESGELGYTWGNWEAATADTTYYGNYFTVWKRDKKDGKWKVALDGGNTTPSPVK